MVKVCTHITPHELPHIFSAQIPTFFLTFLNTRILNHIFGGFINIVIHLIYTMDRTIEKLKEDITNASESVEKYISSVGGNGLSAVQIIIFSELLAIGSEKLREMGIKHSDEEFATELRKVIREISGARVEEY